MVKKGPKNAGKSPKILVGEGRKIWDGGVKNPGKKSQKSWKKPQNRGGGGELGESKNLRGRNPKNSGEIPEGKLRIFVGIVGPGSPKNGFLGGFPEF